MSYLPNLSSIQFLPWTTNSYAQLASTDLREHRFAAKEAIIKAHHSRRLTFHDITILSSTHTSESPDEGSRPPVAVVVSESGSWEEGQIVPLSISHDGDYAVATCMALHGM